MKELKTLKDLEDDEEGGGYEGRIFVDDLKQEAIKWVKEIRKFNELDINEIWFMKFFDLREEDLK